MWKQLYSTTTLTIDEVYKKIVNEPPTDPRFTTSTDKVQLCWTAYNEYLRCAKALSVNDTRCAMLKRATYYCPSKMRDDFKDARGEGKWYGVDFPLQPEEEEEEEEEDEDEDEE